MQGQGVETAATENKAGNLKLGERARLLLASGPDRAALEALRDEIAARITALSLSQSRAPLVFLYQSMVIWLLERKKWLLDCGIGALDAQIWCCKKVIEITEAWE